MEKLFVKEEGDLWSEANPPDGYMVIGTHRTGGGGHRWYAYGQRGASSPQELIAFCQTNPRLFGGGLPFFKVKGWDVIVYTITPGGWIGKAGRWVKGLSACLSKGNVMVKESIKFRTQDHEFLPLGVRFDVAHTSECKEFANQAAKKALDRESLYGSGNNYVGDVVAFLPTEKKWLEDWVKKLRALSDELEAEKRREQDLLAAEAARISGFAYFSSEVSWNDLLDQKFFEWARPKAKKIYEVLGDRPQICRGYIWLGGSCGHNHQADNEMLAKIQANILDGDYEIVPHGNFPGQFRMIHKRGV